MVQAVTPATDTEVSKDAQRSIFIESVNRDNTVCAELGGDDQRQECYGRSNHHRRRLRRLCHAGAHTQTGQ